MKYLRSVAYKTEVINLLSGGSEQLRVATDWGVVKTFVPHAHSSNWKMIHYFKYEGKRVAMVFNGYYDPSGTRWYHHESYYLHNGKKMRTTLAEKLQFVWQRQGEQKCADVSGVVAHREYNNICNWEHETKITYLGYVFYARKIESGGYWVTKQDSADYWDTYWQLAETMRQIKIKVKKVVDHWEEKNLGSGIYCNTKNVSSVRSK